MVAPVTLIVNPRSHRAARALSVEAMRLARSKGATIETVDGEASLEAAVQRAVDARVPLLAVLGGDGTVRGVAEALARRLEAAARDVPDLLVLPGGRSNLTARDLLPAQRALDVLGAALAGGPALRTVERRTLVVEDGDAGARHGLFVAAALLDGVIRRIHAERATGRGPRGFASTLLGLARLAGRALVGRSPLVAPRLSIDAGPLGRLDGAVRWLLVTTLRHERGGFDPYPARGAGAVRIAAVARAAPAQWRRLPSWLAGRWSPAMDAAHGWLGGRTDRVSIAGLDGYTIDGESFAADPARPLVVRGGPALRFVVG